MTTDYKLISKDELTELAKSYELNSWNELTNFVKELPYGRNKNRNDLKLVLTEKKGSCSSKHALLKAIADLNNVPNIKLILGIYKMTQINTPKIGNVLTETYLEFIPEAHCYLKVGEQRLDLTDKSSDIKKIETDIIQEIEIEPKQIAKFKVDYHKTFIKNWIIENNIVLNFNQIWSIRETCIENLSK